MTPAARRVVAVALGLLALGAGFSLGSIGCTSGCDCSGFAPLEGVYEAESERPGAVFSISPAQIEITYGLEDGSEWTVIYEVTARSYDD